MTTTAHEDQFTVAPEPVRQTYDTYSILRRNVADLEIALRKQTERAEKAEAELVKLREQEPIGVAVACNKDSSPGFTVAVFSEADVPAGSSVYAGPVPAPAVPDDWREVMAELAADLQASIEAEHAYRDQYSSVMRKYQNDMRIVERARSLLQSAGGVKCSNGFAGC